MGKICYLMGKSSSGKDTIFKALKESRFDFNTITLYTTRPIREGESDGVEYHFVNDNDLKRMIAQKRVIEVRAYNTKCGIWSYFTVDDGQIDIKKNYIVIGTLESYQSMANYYGRDRLIPIYLNVEDGLRLERALHREQRQTNPKYAEMCRRYLADEKDFSEENLKKAGIDKQFTNNDMKSCLKEIYSYLDKEISKE